MFIRAPHNFDFIWVRCGPTFKELTGKQNHKYASTKQNVKYRAMHLYGGVPYTTQNRGTRQGRVQINGKISDFEIKYNSHSCDLKKVNYLLVSTSLHIRWWFTEGNPFLCDSLYSLRNLSFVPSKSIWQASFSCCQPIPDLSHWDLTRQRRVSGLALSSCAIVILCNPRVCYPSSVSPSTL